MTHDFPVYFQINEPQLGWREYPHLDASGTGNIFFLMDNGFEETDVYANGKITSSGMWWDSWTIYVTYFGDESVKSYLYRDVNGDDVHGYTLDEGPYSIKKFADWQLQGSWDHTFILKNGDVGFHYSAFNDGYRTAVNIDEMVTDLSTHQHYQFSFKGYDHHVSGVDGGRFDQTLTDGTRVWEQGLGNDEVRVLQYKDGLIISDVRYTGRYVSSYSFLDNNGDRTSLRFEEDKVLSKVVQRHDGSQSELNFDGYGSLLKDVEKGADGSIDMLKFKDGIAVDHCVYVSGGKLAYTDKMVTGGGHDIVAHLSGQTLEGHVTNDTFTDFGATTFQFRGNFGQDTVRGFDVASGPDHDVISLAGTAAHAFSDLVIEQMGSNTKITVDASDFITLLNVQAHDVGSGAFLFA